VKWNHFPPDAATWEDFYSMQAFSNSVAWGQATSAGGEGATYAMSPA